MDIEVSSDKENLLIGRREIECIFRGSYGSFNRNDAVQALSKKIKTTNKNVFVISIDGGSGTRDAKGLFYIYDNENNAKKDISEYILTRNKPDVPKPKPSKDSSKDTDEAKAKPTTDGEAKTPVADIEKPSEEKSESKPTTKSSDEPKEEAVKPQEKSEVSPESTNEKQKE